MKNRSGLFLCLFSAVLLLLCISCSSINRNTLKTEKIGNNSSSVIYKSESVQENKIVENADMVLQSHAGNYRLSLPRYTGRIFIRINDEGYYGTIVFNNWGNGTPQPLKDLRISGKKIYFLRSISTRSELKMYGGSSYFRQTFYGVFSNDGNKITGIFKYLGAQDNWSAGKE